MARKPKLTLEQRMVVVNTARLSGIPVNDVLWLYIEFGQMMMIIAETDTDFHLILNKRFGNLPEYEHWKELATHTYQNWKAGELTPEELEKLKSK